MRVNAMVAVPVSTSACLLGEVACPLTGKYEYDKKLIRESGVGQIKGTGSSDTLRRWDVLDVARFLLAVSTGIKIPKAAFRSGQRS